MIRITLFIFVLCYAMLPFGALADEVDPCIRSTEGKEFWFGFMESRWYSENHYVQITISSRYDCVYELYLGKATTPYLTGVLSAGTAKKIDLDYELVEAMGSETVQEKGLHLIADNPINVYALNYDVNSADVAVIFPVDAIGLEHYAVCYEPHFHQQPGGKPGNGRNSEFLVVATEDNTVVTITPSKVTDKLKPANVPFVVYLNRGEVYQVQSENVEGLAGQGDLTGSSVVSNKPIAFFSGSLGTTVPAGDNVSAWDHLYEQIPPLRSWGRKFMAVPLKSREKDTYRILASKDNTHINLGTGESPVILNQGEFYEFSLRHDSPRLIESDKPILLAQYSNSVSVDRGYTGGNGDPFLIIVSPLNQTKDKVTFVAYDSDQIEKYFVNIVVADDAVEDIRLDGMPVTFQQLDGSGYSFAQVDVLPGSHHLESLDESQGFIAYVYGFGGVESYGYGVGFNLDIVLDLGSDLHFEGDTLVLCHDGELVLDAGNAFDEYEWNTGDSLSQLTVTEGGTYWVNGSTYNGCELSDTINVYVSHPTVNLGVDTVTCGPNQVVLNAGNYEQYLWQDDLGGATRSVSSTDEYYVTVTDRYGCKASDTVQIVVNDVPRVRFSGSGLYCGVWETTLQVEIAGVDPSLWDYEGAAQWSISPVGATITASGNDFAKISATTPGEYTVNFTLTTTEGCFDTEQFTLNFWPVPQADFEIYDGDSNDPCSSYKREVAFIGTNGDAAKYHWDFGGCFVLDTLAENHFEITAGANDPNRTVSLVVEEHGCWSDSTFHAIGVKPNFSFSPDTKRGCDELTVLFSAEVDITDQIAYAWDFGDGATSTASQPTHFYDAPGKYDVSLWITNLIDGCKNGYREEKFVEVFETPVGSFSADENYCYNDTLIVRYPEAIDSSFCSWFSADADLVFADADSAWFDLSRNAVSEIQLVVEEFGCSGDTARMNVRRIPSFNFYPEMEEGCQPFETTLLTESPDDFIQYYWFTELLSDEPGEALNYTYLNEGYHSAKVMAVSMQTGCSLTLQKDSFVLVHPRPKAKFEVDFPKATIANPTLSFSNFSERNAFNYWTFGDGGASVEMDPKHTYSAIGDYTVWLETETDQGCVDATSMEISIIPFSQYAPNAFNPNSPIEANRLFKPVTSDVDPTRFNFRIMNRWGNVVFETKDPDVGWNGALKSGKPAMVGTYIWVMEFSDVQGFRHRRKGAVLLVR